MNSYIPPMRFVPAMRPAMGRVMPSAGVYAPSGALTSQQILDLQGALVWLGRMPASGITGRMPVASPAVLRDFQDNYNRDPAVRSRGYSPRPPIGVDGLWGPTTQAALQNFVPGARAAAASRGIPQVPVDIPVEADGWHGAPGPGAQATLTPIGKPGVTTMVKGNTPAAATPSTAVRPSTSAPAVTPPAPMPPASTFPTGPAIALGVGAVAIVGALYYRSRKKRSGGKG